MDDEIKILEYKKIRKEIEKESMIDGGKLIREKSIWK